MEDKNTYIINVIEDLKESGEIQSINYKWDEENNTFDVFIIPKQTIKHINVDFIILPIIILQK